VKFFPDELSADSWLTRLWFSGFFTIIYSLFIIGAVGWRSDHNFFLAIVGFTLITHKYTFRFCLALSAFVFFWIIYDAMRIYPNYLFNPVHVVEPYEAELWLFGIMKDGVRLIPCEWLALHTNDYLSFVSGISYLLWVPGPIIYTLYLWYKNDDRFIDFSYGFLLTNFLGFIIYYSYPAAPPWYYLNFGDATDFTIPGSEGLLAEFDRIVNTPIFHGIYAKNANVFAAIPSLHASYPIISLLFSIRHGHRGFVIFFSLLTVGIWFAAVYSQHHYIIDLLLGGICAVCAYLLMLFLLDKTFVQKWRVKMSSLILS
jgi:hypothetical protein